MHVQHSCCSTVSTQSKADRLGALVPHCTSHIHLVPQSIVSSREICDSWKIWVFTAKMFPAAFRSKLARGIYPVISQKRAAGGNLNKNIRVEENSGLREISYWTWEFSPTSCTRILLYWILPSMALYSLMQTEFVSGTTLFIYICRVMEPQQLSYFNRNTAFDEQEVKNAQVGKKVSYGIIPRGSEA